MSEGMNGADVNRQLRKDLQDLRSKLDIIAAELTQGDTEREAVRSIEEAVSSVRSNLWTLLSAQNADDYHGFLGKFRVRRATELCEDVLADLHAETLPRSTPGLQVFYATLKELFLMCERQTSATAPEKDGAA